jgi:GTP-binding protein HflX
MNKIDRLPGAEPRRDDATSVRERVWLSAQQQTGLEALRDAIAERCGRERMRAQLDLPPQAARLHARLHALGAVRDEQHSDDGGWHMTLDLPRELAAQLAAEPGGDALHHLLEAS